jgi:hypothetical protein
MEKCHELPPVVLDIILELRAILTIVIHSAETIVDLTGWKNKTILLCVGDYILKKVVFLIGHKGTNIALVRLAISSSEFLKKDFFRNPFRLLGFGKQDGKR